MERKLLQDRWDIPLILYCKIGMAPYIKGLDIALQSMKEGEIAEYIVYCEYSFQPGESSPVPAGTDIILKLELIEITTDKTIMAELEEKEKLEFAKSKKLKGNDFFAKSNYRYALHQYVKGLSALI